MHLSESMNVKKTVREGSVITSGDKMLWGQRDTENNLTSEDVDNDRCGDSTIVNIEMATQMKSLLSKFCKNSDASIV